MYVKIPKIKYFFLTLCGSLGFRRSRCEGIAVMSCSPCSSSLRFSSPSFPSYSRAATSTFHLRDSSSPPNEPKFPSKKFFISVSSNQDSIWSSRRTFEITNSFPDRDGNPPGEPPTGGGGGGGEEDDNKEEEEEEFGPVMKFEEVIREAEARGASLPSDMLDAAKSIGIRRLLLLRYLDLQASPWPLGAAMRSCSLLRRRMLADPSFLFKVGTEVVIDSCCGTFAEIQKRGDDFWPEFELFAADMLVGAVVDVALVSLLAPYVRIGNPSSSTGIFGGISRACASLPSSVFEAERPGSRFSIKQRIGTYFYKGVLYGSVGFVCGIIGQGIANLVMTAKRNVNKSEEDVPIPPLVKSAALWGVFLAVSSNTRYQIVNGLEQAVESSPITRRIPLIAMAFTVGVRFANNIYGGMQFVDWARRSGVQ